MLRALLLFACLAPWLLAATALADGHETTEAATAGDTTPSDPASAEAGTPETTPVSEPKTPEEEVRLLGDYGIAYTTRALQGGAQFYPFAFIMRSDGKIQRVGPKELPDFPTQDKLLRTLVEGFRDVAEKGGYRAVAIVADVVIEMPDGRESDAIQLGLEHGECFFRNVFYPYTLSEEGVLSFGKPLSGGRRPRVFVGCQ